jgi:hypothetical protein
MKLYYSPGSCSLSPHIVAREAGLPVELSRVTFDGATRTTAESEDFFQVNPRGGYVPALRMDDGDVLEEGVAIVQYRIRIFFLLTELRATIRHSHGSRLLILNCTKDSVRFSIQLFQTKLRRP